MPQWIATTQFFLYGKEYCTKTGYDKALKERQEKAQAEGVKYHDILDDYKKAYVDANGDFDASVAQPVLENLPKRNHVYVITGANAGIGFEITQRLAYSGATVYMVCRNPTRAAAAQEKIVKATKNNNVHVLQCDVSLETEVRSVWKRFEEHQKEHYADVQQVAGKTRLDGLVCNAGVLLNDVTPTSEGIETTFACHLLFGTYLLTSLAINALENTKDSRVVVVSSGGMYNTKFPEFDIATARKGDYNGNLAYAYAKRAQVLLCEEWTKTYPKVKFVSCHPGWCKTEAVDAAYGEQAKYLEPMRTPLEGADGIIWLCIAPTEQLQSGEFYLDRLACRKHLGGAFFSDGTFTKNTKKEVQVMLKKLEQWSSADTRPEPITLGKNGPLNNFMPPMASRSDDADKCVDVEGKFMGDWHVWAVIPTALEPNGAVNCTENYTWNKELKCVDVTYDYYKPGETKKSTIKQRGFMDNKENTQWRLKGNFFLNVYIPIPVRYLVVYCDEAYEHVVIGVPNREYVWVMGRKPLVSNTVTISGNSNNNEDDNMNSLKQEQDAKLKEMVNLIDNLGHDVSKLQYPKYDPALASKATS